MVRGTIVAKVLLGALTFLALLGAPGFSSQALGAPKAANLEGMGYQAARKIVLSYGWKPVAAGPCYTGKDTCARFPEIASCSGVAPGYCAMAFVNEKRCLYLTTSGGQPQGDEEGDTHVVAVSFRPGPCAKN
jgi:hypothetical protein